MKNKKQIEKDDFSDLENAELYESAESMNELNH